jgi:hypothetical protein
MFFQRSPVSGTKQRLCRQNEGSRATGDSFGADEFSDAFIWSLEEPLRYLVLLIPLIGLRSACASRIDRILPWNWQPRSAPQSQAA